MQLQPHHHRLIRLRQTGQSYDQIAKQLRISTNTVIYHFQQIYKRLEIHNTAGLAEAYATYRKNKNLPTD